MFQSRKQITIIQKTDKKIHDMSSAINEIDMEFEEIKNVNIETIGSLSQITRPCPSKYKSMKAQHQPRFNLTSSSLMNSVSV
jgi:hypothetical protein